jgi:hypothetical protein
MGLRGVYHLLEPARLLVVLVRDILDLSSFLMHESNSTQRVNMILIRDHAPSDQALGTTNGIAQLFMSLARAIAPAAVSSAFALANDSDLLGGQIWALMMIAVSLLGICATRSIMRSAAETVEGKDNSLRN